MTRILITGANSYIGMSLERWLYNRPEQYQIDTIDMIDGTWMEKDFSVYDVVFHVAGIAHVSSDRKMESFYYKVNRDLAVETARKSKADGVKQFIFMSSIIVYGDSSLINSKRVIDQNTVPKPENHYGNSKLQAEAGIQILQEAHFNVVVLRPPMIYGIGSKGNYPKLAQLARKLPIFPDIDNERSMLYIDNLCEFIRLMIDNKEKGVFFPQNSEYVKTSEMVRIIAEAYGKKIRLVKIFNPFVIMVSHRLNVLNKVFGNFTYKEEMSEYKSNYRIFSLKQSIMITEG